jgi:hypothetical protein
LFDPYSAQLGFAPLKFAWAKYSGIGYFQCGVVNAKNRFGGYVGAEAFYVVIRNHQAVDSLIDGQYPSKPALTACKKILAG